MNTSFKPVGNPLGFGSGREYGSPQVDETNVRRLRKAVKLDPITPGRNVSVTSASTSFDDGSAVSALHESKPLLSHSTLASLGESKDDRGDHMALAVPRLLSMVESRIAVEQGIREGLTREVGRLRDAVFTLEHSSADHSAAIESLRSRQAALAQAAAARASELAPTPAATVAGPVPAELLTAFRALSEQVHAMQGELSSAYGRIESLEGRLAAVDSEHRRSASLRSSGEQVQETAIRALQAGQRDLLSLVGAEQASRAAGDAATDSRLQDLVRRVSGVADAVVAVQAQANAQGSLVSNSSYVSAQGSYGVHNPGTVSLESPPGFAAMGSPAGRGRRAGPGQYGGYGPGQGGPGGQVPRYDSGELISPPRPMRGSYPGHGYGPGDDDGEDASLDSRKVVTRSILETYLSGLRSAIETEAAVREKEVESMRAEFTVRIDRATAQLTGLRTLVSEDVGARLEGVVSAVTSAVSELSKGLQQQGVTLAGVAATVEQEKMYARDNTSLLRDAIVKRCDALDAAVRANAAALQRKEATISDALIRGLEAESKDRQAALEDVAAKISSCEQCVTSLRSEVSSSLSSVQAAVATAVEERCARTEARVGQETAARLELEQQLHKLELKSQEDSGAAATRTNQRLRELETSISQARTQALEAGSTAKSLQDSVSQKLAGTVQDLRVTLSGHTAAIGELRGSVGTLSTDMAELRVTVTSQVEAVGGLRQGLKGTTHSVETVQNQIMALSESVMDVKHKLAGVRVGAASAAGAAALTGGTEEALRSQLQELQQQLQQHEAMIDSQGEAINQVQAVTLNLQAGAGSGTKAATAQQQQQGGTADRAWQEAMEQRVSQVKDDLEDAVAGVRADAAEAVTELHQRVTALENWAATAADQSAAAAGADDVYAGSPGGNSTGTDATVSGVVVVGMPGTSGTRPRLQRQPSLPPFSAAPSGLARSTSGLGSLSSHRSAGDDGSATGSGGDSPQFRRLDSYKELPQSSAAGGDGDVHGPVQDEVRAATKIQAVARGRAVRKEVVGAMSSVQPASHVQAAAASPDAETAEDEDDLDEAAEAQAAVKIQAVARGRVERKKVAALKGQRQQQQGATDDADAETEHNDGGVGAAPGQEMSTEEEAAAARIQAIARGRADRRKVADIKARQRAASLFGGVPTDDSGGMEMAGPGEAGDGVPDGGAEDDGGVDHTVTGDGAADNADDEDGQQDRAAARIQAIARGRSDRKRVADLKAARTAGQATGTDAEPGAQADAAKVQQAGDGDGGEVKAATKIQAVARGRKDRKKVQALKGGAASATGTEPDDAEGQHHNDENVDPEGGKGKAKAGHPREGESKGDDDQNAETESHAPSATGDDGEARAATKIQAAARGRKDRKKVSELKQQQKDAGSDSKHDGHVVGDEGKDGHEPAHESTHGQDTTAPDTAPDRPADGEAKAATKIQAIARGRADRKKVQELKVKGQGSDGAPEGSAKSGLHAAHSAESDESEAAGRVEPAENGGHGEAHEDEY